MTAIGIGLLLSRGRQQVVTVTAVGGLLTCAKAESKVRQTRSTERSADERLRDWDSHPHDSTPRCVSAVLVPSPAPTPDPISHLIAVTFAVTTSFPESWVCLDGDPIAAHVNRCVISATVSESDRVSFPAYRLPADHQVREWSSKLRKQTYLLDRQIRAIQREEAKVKVSLKQAAKKGDKDVCLILAKEIVNSRKAVNRINASKAQLNSVSLHMNQQAANLRVAGVMEKSADVMKAMHSLVRVHEISEVMRDLSKEMTKAGIMEEMMEETMESTSGMDEEELEEEVQKEVDKVLFDLTEGEHFPPHDHYLSHHCCAAPSPVMITEIVTLIIFPRS